MIRPASAFRSLVRREVRDQLRQPLFIVMASVAIAIVPIAMNEGTRHLFNRTQAVQRLEEQRISDRSRSGGRLLGQGTEPALRVIRPVATGSVFVAGLESALPEYWDFSPAGLMVGGRDSSAPTRSASPLDFGFALRDVLGLLALLLAVETLAGERDTGQLSTLLTQPVTSASVLWAKFIGGVCVLGLAVGTAAIASLVVVAWRDPSVLSDETLTLLSLLVTAGILYLAATYAAGLLIAVIVRRRQTAMVVGLAFWIVTATVFEPTLSGKIAVALAERDAVEDRTAPQFRTLLASSEEAGGDLCLRLGGSVSALSHDTLDDQTRAAVQQRWLEDAEARRRIIHTGEAQAITSVEHDLLTARVISLIVPSSEFSELSSALSETGWASVRRWIHSTEAYQSELDRTLFDSPPRMHIVVRASGSRFVFYLDRRAPTSASELAAMMAPVATMRQRVLDAAPGAVALVVWGLTCMCLATVRFRVIMTS